MGGSGRAPPLKIDQGSRFSTANRMRVSQSHEGEEFDVLFSRIRFDGPLQCSGFETKRAIRFAAVGRRHHAEAGADRRGNRSR